MLSIRGASSGALVALVVGILAGCGGDDAPEVFQGIPVAEPGPVHVHGLGYDEQARTLYIATHTGLWKLPDGEREAARVTDRRQDTMGFTVVRPGLFLGSGHPDAREADPDVPPLLGLIRSTDDGESWERVSLHGRADLHVLRAAGSRIYGFDATHERLLRSVDGGRSWTRAGVPEPLIDLAIDPADPRHLLGSGEVALHESTDAGLTWSVAAARPGYLAWPRTGRLYLFAPNGDVLRSSGPAGLFRRVGSVGDLPHAVLAVGDVLFAALEGGTIVSSDDGGRNWRARFTP